MNLKTLYGAKPGFYFAQARDDLAELVDGTSHRILEVGCGTGNTGALLKSSGKASYVAGVELLEEMATQARGVLDEVICGDIESARLPFAGQSFGYILFGDVLEHTVNPWHVLQNTRRLLRPDGYVLASIPNIRHWTVVSQLILSGEWTYGPYGILDQTHLRFFTRKSAIKMFEDTGFAMVRTEPYFAGPQSRTVSRFTGRYGTEFLAQRWLFKARFDRREK